MLRHSMSSEGSYVNMTPLPASLEQATEFMINRARDLVRELARDREWDEPPFLAKDLAALQGVKDIVHADLGESDGALLRYSDGYVIKVNVRHSQVRQNFSCAHEIGHIILDEFMQQRSSSKIDFRRQASEIERAKERLCDIAAAELLMPQPIFSKYLSGFGVSIDSVKLLARVFKVSIPAAAIRMAEVSLEPCLAILWKPWRKRKSKYLRAAWALGPGRGQDKDWFFPRNTCVAKGSKLFKAYETDSTVSSFKFVDMNREKRRCYIESKGFGLNERRYVISLAFLNR